jgi:hypothetical protein
MSRILALMGSGENSPIMVTPHQKIIKSTGTNLNPINLNTPYGFQENIDELSAKIEKYFDVNVGAKITTSSDPLADIPNAGWVFAGPGSPTYALRQWRSTGIDKALIELTNWLLLQPCLSAQKLCRFMRCTKWAKILIGLMA